MELTLVIISVFLGIFFRLYNLKKKVFWGDEAHTCLRVCGFSQEDAFLVLNNPELTIGDVQQFQRIKTGSSYRDVVRAIILDEPHRPPLHHLLVRSWVEIFGVSIYSLRFTSVIFSLISLPLFYIFVYQLSASVLAAQVSLAILCLSPFQVIYAQEAREYSLWTLLLILLGISFLAAVHNPYSLFALAGYAVSVAACCYCAFFSVAIVFGLTVLGVFSNFNILLAGLAGFACFIPWILITWQYRHSVDRMTSWRTAREFRLKESLLLWGLNISVTVLDEMPGWEAVNRMLSFTVPPALLFLPIISSLPLVSQLLLLVIGLSPLFYVIIPDLFCKTVVSSVTRYFTPMFLVIPIYFGASLANHWEQPTAKILTILLLSLNFVSYVGFVFADTWWNKGYLGDEVIALVAEYQQPGIVATSGIQGNSFGVLLSASHYLTQPVP